MMGYHVTGLGMRGSTFEKKATYESAAVTPIETSTASRETTKREKEREKANPGIETTLRITVIPIYRPLESSNEKEKSQ